MIWEALGDATPDGPVLGARCPTWAPRRRCSPTVPQVYSTIPHFDGYPAVLVWLDLIGVEELTALITEAWHARDPKRLAAEQSRKEYPQREGLRVFQP